MTYPIRSVPDGDTAWGSDIRTAIAGVNDHHAVLGDSVLIFGADRTGITSSTTAFQNAINTGDVIIPAGTYRVGKINYTGNASRRIVALGRVTIIQTDANGVFELKGGWDALGTVSSYSTANANLVTPGESAPGSSDQWTTVLTMAAPVTVAVADILKIVGDDQNPLTDDASNRVGEYVLAGKASAASTTVTLSEILIETYTTAVRLARLWDVRFEISGPIIFDTDPAIRDTGGWFAVLRLRAARDCYVGGGVEFRNCLGRAIANAAYATRVDGVKFRSLANRPTKSHYGYAVSDCGRLTRMTGCISENVRHHFTSGGEGASAGSTLYEDFGASHYAHIADCVSHSDQGQFDTHADSYRTTFENCKAVGTFIGASSGGYGFSVRGRDNVLIACTVIDSTAGFGIFGENALLVDCHAWNCHNSALDMGGDYLIGHPDMKKQRVVGGEFESSAVSMCSAVLGSRAGFTMNIELENVRFTKFGAAGNGPRHVEIHDGVALTFKDVTFDWGRYASAHSVFGFYVNGANSSIAGRGIRNLCGAAPITAAVVIGVNYGVTGATATPIYATDIEHRHSSVEAEVIQSNFTAARSSWRQYFGTAWYQQKGSNDLVLTAATNAVLPIADKLDPVIAVRLTGTAGAVGLAAIPATGLVPGQTLYVVNDSNGIVTISGRAAIAVGAVGRYVFAQGSWWTA